MKTGKRKLAVLLLLTLLFTTAFPYMESQAGRNETRLTSESLTDAHWGNIEEDIVAKDGVLEFPETSTEYTRYISKAAAKKEEGFQNLLQMSATAQFEKLPAGKKFIFGFALSSIEAIHGEEGNIEVTFENNNGVKVSIVTFDKDGNEIVLATAKNCGASMASKVNVKVVITTDEHITVTVNGKNIHSVKLPGSGEGRVGFLQTGECKVKISNVDVVHYQYDRPENSNVFEDFENGDMNASVLTAKMLSYYESFPMGQKIEDYNGNKVLMFRNTNRAYLGTTQQYSNFEITFDVPYMLTETVFEDGAMAKRKQGQIMVTFGGEQADWSNKGWEFAADSVVYTDYGMVVSNNDPQNTKAKMEKDPFQENGRPFSVKVTVVDGKVTAGIKWMEEKNFDTVLTYQLKGGMPMGYVCIWASGAGYMALDNVRVTNLDESPNLVKKEFTSGKYKRPGDWEYKEMERVYKTFDDEENAQDSRWWYLLIPSSITLGAAVVITTYVLINRKKKVKKERTINEVE